MHRTRDIRSAISSSQFAMLAVLLITALVYARALDFGFFWDDPLWYGRVVGKSVGELLRPMPEYHFYRPALVLYNRLFVGPDDTPVAPLLHAAQIGWHLLNVALAYALSCRLGVGKWRALAVGTLVAWYPFSYQAVAWAAPAQPMAAALLNAALLAYFAARRKRAGTDGVPSERLWSLGLSLLLFLAALAIQEGAAALAVLPLLTEWVLHRRNANQAKWWLSLTYPLVAAGFGLLWLRVPREAGYTGFAFDSSAVLYFLQGVIFPLLGRPAGGAPDQIAAPVVLFALTGLTLSGLLVASWRARQGRQALLGLAWGLLGTAPAAIGLEYSYVKLGSRLLYYASPGVALLWACALLPSAHKSLTRRLWRIGGAVLLALIALQSGLLLTDFRRMYATGTAHLSELIQVAQAGEDRLLFVNFPDRYVPKRPPYPLGYWGMTLAPVSVDLGDFPAIAADRHPRTISRSMPWIDTEARDAGPYQVDMRGIITQPDQLYQLAHQMDAVYLSRYFPDGTFDLQWAGAVIPASATLPVDPTPACRLTVFEGTLCLQEAEVDLQPRQLSITLTWLSLSKAQLHDTIFAHLGLPGQPPVAQADGDAWLGMLPLDVWQPGDTIREQRFIPLSEGIGLGHYEVRIGVYNRITGQRLPATTPQGEPLPGNAVTIGRVP